MDWQKYLFALPVAGAVAWMGGCSSEEPEKSQGGTQCQPYGDLCAEVPLSEATSACGTSAVNAVPQSYSDDVQEVSTCEYQGPTGGSDIAIKTWTGCFKDSGPPASEYYDSAHDDPPATGATKHDVAGLGDRAYYEEDLSSGDATLYVLDGASLLYVQDNQASGPADATLPCLIDIASKILASR